MPSITTWTRLEPRAIGDDPLPGLQARIADPLWLLARQWQLGAFRGEDGGSPVSATVRTQSAPITRFLPRAVDVDEQANGEPCDPHRPFEATIAREPAPPDVRMRARAGRRLVEALERADRSTRASHYLAAAPLEATGDLAILAGRVPDGFALRAIVERELASEADDTVRAVLTEWLAWCNSRFGAGASAWASDRLEYQISAQAAGTPALVASVSDATELDWHTFDVRPGAGLGATEAATTRTVGVVPQPVQYAGMPSSRFWQIEDDRVFFGGVDVEPEDLGRMLFVELALVGADDWFVVPVPLSVGAVHQVTALEVLDTFGRVSSIAPVDGGRAGGPRWSMFHTSQRGGAPLPLLVLPPSPKAVLRGEPIEDVAFVRDEAANIGWAIERVVEDVAGRALDLVAAEPPAAPEPARDAPAYRLRTDVPSYWTPLVPVELSPGVIELRRGRLAGDNAPRAVRGQVLGETTAIREEALPRSGLNVRRTWVYARSIDGTIHTWRTRATTPRTAVAASGLAHDILVGAE